MEETPQTVPQSTWHPRNLASENSLPHPSGLASPLPSLPSASLPTIPFPEHPLLCHCLGFCQQGQELTCGGERGIQATG